MKSGWSRLLSVSTEAIAWAVSVYLLVIVGTILIFGRLGDTVGKTLGITGTFVALGSMSAAPKNMLGISGSVNALIRNMGMISGISIAVLLLYSRMSHRIGYLCDYVQGRDDVFIYGMKGAYLPAALICAGKIETMW